MLPGEPPLRSEKVDNVKADIVARPVVFRAWITESNNQANLRGFLLQNFEANAELLPLLFFLRRCLFLCPRSRCGFRFFLLLADHFRSRGRFHFSDNGLFLHGRGQH